MINYAYFGAQINICTFDDILKIKFTRSELFFLSIFFFFWNRKPRYIGAWRYCARCFTPILLSQWSGSGLFCSTPTRPKPVCFTITCRACFKFSFCFWMEMRDKILMFADQTIYLWSSPVTRGDLRTNTTYCLWIVYVPVFWRITKLDFLWVGGVQCFCFVPKSIQRPDTMSQP